MAAVVGSSRPTLVVTVPRPTGKADLVAAVRAMHNVLGGTIDPHASYLLLRGMKVRRGTAVAAPARVGGLHATRPGGCSRVAPGGSMDALVWHAQTSVCPPPPQTLDLRVERQNRTALEIARRLESHPKVGAWRCCCLWACSGIGCCGTEWMCSCQLVVLHRPAAALLHKRSSLPPCLTQPSRPPAPCQVLRVHYPGLESHPDHAIAVAQMTGYGGVVSQQLGHD